MIHHPLTCDERRCYADADWRGDAPNPVLERLWEAYVALEDREQKLREAAKLAMEALDAGLIAPAVVALRWTLEKKEP